jgi:hypothetical protein
MFFTTFDFQFLKGQYICAYVISDDVIHKSKY